jgi:hypothetical protein
MRQAVCLLIAGALLAPAQDPVASAPPTTTDIEAERRASEERIARLQSLLEEQKAELERQKSSLSQLETRLRDQKGYVTKDEFAEYQKAVSAFQNTLTSNLRQQEAIERLALESRLKTELALYENSEAALQSLIANLSGLLNTANTAKALIQLPSPVATSPRYQAALKGLEEQARKKQFPSIAQQLASTVPQAAWLSTAVSLYVAFTPKGPNREEHLSTLVCARDFADSVESSKRARLQEIDAAIDKLAKLRERMTEAHARITRNVASSPGAAFRERAASYFNSMRSKSGETPSQALTQLDERLRAARREIAAARALLAEYRQAMETVSDMQDRLRDYVLTHQKFTCAGGGDFTQDVSRSLASLEEAREQFRRMIRATESQESIKVLDSVL